MSNLLAQRKEIKRLEKEGEQRRAEDVEREREKEAEGGRRAVEEFERTMLGLEGRKGIESGGAADGKRHEGGDGGRGVKRKFELDEDEMLKSVKSDRARARKAIEDEEVSSFYYHRRLFSCNH